MSLPQPLSPYPTPASPSPRPRRRRRRSTALVAKPRSLRVQALEISAKLTVNLILATAATAALVRLIPYSQAQASKLQDVRTAVQVAEQETNGLRDQFTRYFDPYQASSIMQEQSGREDPSERSVVWIKPH